VTKKSHVAAYFTDLMMMNIAAPGTAWGQFKDSLQIIGSKLDILKPQLPEFCSFAAHRPAPAGSTNPH